MDSQCEDNLKHAEYYFILKKSSHSRFIEGRYYSNDEQAKLDSSFVGHVGQSLARLMQGTNHILWTIHFDKSRPNGDARIR